MDMKTPTKFVTALSEQEHSRLVENHQTNDNFRVRNRSHAILLSSEKFSVAEIAGICRADRDTVSGWIDKWNECGFDALADDEKSGRPPILTEEEEEKAIAIALQNPKFPHRQIGQIKHEIGKEISKYMLKDLLKKRLSLEENKIRFMEEGG